MGPGQTGELEEGRREIDEADVVLDDAAVAGDASGPHGGERHVIGGFVGAAFAAREGQAVVGGDDDQRVVEEPAFLEGLEHAPEVAIEVLDLVGVVEEVVAHGGVVGPKRGDAVDVGELFAALFHAGAEFVIAVRLSGAVPKNPRLIGGSGGEEVVEVGGVIGGIDAGSRGWGAARVEGAAGHGAGFAVIGASDAGAPALGGVADEPAVFGEGLAPAFELGGEIREVVGGGFELPRITAREDASAGGRAFGVGRVGAGEKNAVAGDAIEVRRAHPRRTIRAGVDTPIVGDGEEDVGRAIGGAQQHATQQQERKELHGGKTTGRTWG